MIELWLLILVFQLVTNLFCVYHSRYSGFWGVNNPLEVDAGNRLPAIVPLGIQKILFEVSFCLRIIGIFIASDVWPEK
jgi:hypothetical protein